MKRISVCSIVAGFQVTLSGWFWVTPDSEGRFRPDGFRTGTWTCTALLGDGGQRDFPNLELPVYGENPYSLHLVMSSGLVSGTLVDSGTGSELGEKGPSWWIFLIDQSNEQVIARTQGGQKGSKFKLNGIPSGKYRLLIKAKGYQDLETEPFYLSEGDSKDLGHLLIMPAGKLLLKLLTQSGEPVEDFSATCNGQTLFSWQWEKEEPGLYSLQNLPAGPVTLKITASGFCETILELTLAGGQTEEREIVMKPE